MNCRYICTALLALIAGPVFAQVDQVLPPMGGPGGGQFFARCRQGDILVGLDLRVGDDVDAIRPICARLNAPTYQGERIVSPMFTADLHSGGPINGGKGGAPAALRCPNAAPAVNGLEVAYEGESTVIINNIHLFCGLALPNQPLTNYPTQVFDGPAIGEADRGVLIGGRRIPLGQARATCPPGLVAVGINGRSGRWLDAVSLICGALPYDPNPGLVQPKNQPAKSLGRVNSGTEQPRPPASICDAARDAISRQSPAARNLLAQCQATGGSATSVTSNADLEQVRMSGEFMCSMDNAAGELRGRLDTGARRGFEIGLGIWGKDAAAGPGKQRYRDALTTAERKGFDIAADYALTKNKHAKLIEVGSAIARTDEEVAKARNADPDVFFGLGFDIASGLFGDPAAGSEGSKVVGAGAMAIRNALNDAGRRGFDASTKLHLSRSYP